jgi:hypothetical protein
VLLKGGCLLLLSGMAAHTTQKQRAAAQRSARTRDECEKALAPLGALRWPRRRAVECGRVDDDVDKAVRVCASGQAQKRERQELRRERHFVGLGA